MYFTEGLENYVKGVEMKKELALFAILAAVVCSNGFCQSKAGFSLELIESRKVWEKASATEVSTGIAYDE